MSNVETLYKIYNQDNTKNVKDFKKFFYRCQEQFENIDFNRKTVLDIGCGRGFVSLYIHLVKGTDAEKIVAIDEYEGCGENKENYDFLKKIIEENSLDIELQKMDFLQNNFSPNSFDVIIANNAVHHMVRTDKQINNDHKTRNQWINVFTEIKRLLKTDGILILKENTRFNLWRYLPLRFRYIGWSIHPSETPRGKPRGILCQALQAC